MTHRPFTFAFESNCVFIRRRINILYNEFSLLRSRRRVELLLSIQLNDRSCGAHKHKHMYKQNSFPKCRRQMTVSICMCPFVCCLWDSNQMKRIKLNDCKVFWCVGDYTMCLLCLLSILCALLMYHCLDFIPFRFGSPNPSLKSISWQSLVTNW